MKDYDFRIGDKVFSLTYGNGIVVRRDENNRFYAIGVEFERSKKKNDIFTYTKDGRQHIPYYRNLYHGHNVEVIVKETIPTRDGECWLCVYRDLKNQNIARSILYSSCAEAVEKSKENWSDDWEIIHGPVKIGTKEVENESI